MALKVVTPSDPRIVTKMPVAGYCLATACPRKINVAIKKGEASVIINPSCELTMDNPPGSRPIPKTYTILAANQLIGATIDKAGNALPNFSFHLFDNCSIF